MLTIPKPCREKSFFLPRKLSAPQIPESWDIIWKTGFCIIWRGWYPPRSRRSFSISRNTLISMLEKLFFGMDAEEKKQVLTAKYGLVMTAELERRMRVMCNLSEGIFERGMEGQLAKLIQIKIGKGKTVSQIAEELEETEERIEELIERMGLSSEMEIPAANAFGGS